VVESLEEWQPDANETGSTHRIRERLDYELNANAQSPWDRAVVELSGGSLAGDVVVDGQVGIVILTRTTWPTCPRSPLGSMC
jgi:hypothetical protein